jgi:hypothetical protein
MLETIGNLLGDVAVYVAALLGLVALYFLWIAFREWRTGQRATFGIERDIARSEMMGAIARAAGVVLLGVLVYALGQLGHPSEPSDEPSVQATQPSIATISVLATPTQAPGLSAPTLMPTDTPQPELTNVPPLPSDATQPPDAEPASQVARVSAFGGVWLRDAPNGGTIEVLPQETIVEFMEGSEFAGSYEWQKVRVLNTPPGSEGIVGQEGWVAAQFLEVSP